MSDTHTTLGRTLVIANPAARSGHGKQAAERIARQLELHTDATSDYAVKLTGAPGDAGELARSAGDADTVIALGGDGVIHEVACGLMTIGEDKRPRLGVIPMGSGNDFARTLGLAKNAPAASLGQLLRGTSRPLDVGRVNGVHYLQTLSFGLDAAIALDTMGKRSDTAAGRGSHLFAVSAVQILSSCRDGWHYVATIDDEHVEGTETIFAVQLGPTYGGGFRICPGASPTDGLLDVCYSLTLPATTAATLALLGRARFGAHTSSSHLRLARAASITIDFDEAPPCQVDGERLEGTHFQIDVLPGALEVIVPQGFRG